MVRVGHRAYLSLVLKMLQDASKGRAEFRLVLPTLSHDTIPGEKQEFMPTHSCEESPSLGNTPYSHRPWTVPGRVYVSPSNYKVLSNQGRTCNPMRRSSIVVPQKTCIMSGGN